MFDELSHYPVDYQSTLNEVFRKSRVGDIDPKTNHSITSSYDKMLRHYLNPNAQNTEISTMNRCLLLVSHLSNHL